MLIATGGAPNHGAAIPGIEHVISSNEVFHLPQLPKRIVIQGGGYIALEFACIFAGFGSDVTLIYRGDNILRGFDEDVRAHVRDEMEKNGITILTGCTVNKVDKHGSEFTTHLSNGSSIASDQVMFAIGRHPAVANLGLENDRRRHQSREWRHRRRQFLEDLGADHLRDRRRHPSHQPDAGRDPRGPCLRRHRVRQAHGRGRPCATFRPRCFRSRRSAPSALTEAEARAQFSHVDIYKTNFRPMKATMSGRDTRVLMKLVVDGTTDRVVGCHIVGDGAAEMIQLLGIAVKMKATKADFDATMALHPTAAEELVTMRTPTRAACAGSGGVGRRQFCNATKGRTPTTICA